MLLSRKNPETNALPLPEAWIKGVIELLTETYKGKLKDNMTFQIYGFTYPNELILLASLINVTKESAMPITLSLSADLEETTDSEKLLKTMVDHVGYFFDQYFTEAEWDDYDPNWQDVKGKEGRIFYRVTRENVGLTLKANELLNSQE